jgi:hypothetical protein
MKTQFFFLVLLIVTAFLLTACPVEIHDDWYFDNHTNDALVVYMALGIASAYPDTLLPSDVNNMHIGRSDPHSKQPMYANGYVKPEDIVKGLPLDTLSIFIIFEDTLLTYSWEVIRSDYKILKRYDLSLQDLQKLNYTIPYPPTETMKNMKMYPPYGE